MSFRLYFSICCNLINRHSSMVAIWKIIIYSSFIVCSNLINCHSLFVAGAICRTGLHSSSPRGMDSWGQLLVQPEVRNPNNWKNTLLYDTVGEICPLRLTDCVAQSVKQTTGWSGPRCWTGFTQWFADNEDTDDEYEDPGSLRDTEVALLLPMGWFWTGKITLSMTMSRIWTSSSSLSWGTRSEQWQCTVNLLR